MRAPHILLMLVGIPCVIAVIFLTYLCLREDFVWAGNTQAADSALKSLEADLANGTIARADIFVMEYLTATRFPITPETLEVNADAKFNFDVPSNTGETLMRAVRSTKLHQIKGTPDLRWGAVFWDKAGIRVHSIYLDGRYICGTGRKGVIDGVPAGLNRSIIDWFEGNFYRP